LNFLYMPIASLWCYFSHTWAHVWLSGHISGKLVLNHDLSTHIHWLTVILLQSYMSPCITYWTYFWQISPNGHIWTNGHISGKLILSTYPLTPSGVRSVHTVVHIWLTEHISDQTVFDTELLTYTHRSLLMSHQP